MSEGDLYCNAAHCRRLISSVGWVTFCSHIFCTEDGSRSFTQIPCNCPACGTEISSKNEVLRVDLEPTEHFKNMILAGLKPEIIRDICNRGMNFWMYQMEKERQHQLQGTENLKLQLTEQEQHFKKLLRNANNEVISLSRQLETVVKDKENLREQKSNISLRLSERTRQYQQLKNLYESQRQLYGKTASTAVPYGYSQNVGTLFLTESDVEEGKIQVNPHPINSQAKYPPTYESPRNLPSYGAFPRQEKGPAYDSQPGRNQFTTSGTLDFQFMPVQPSQAASAYRR